MAPDNCLPAKNSISSTRQNDGAQEDAELIAHYENQRKAAKSSEWIECIDAMIRQLRHGSTAKSNPFF
jgi:hypothetical protein